MKTIRIDNRDTENIHIDTYQMLTGDSADECTIDWEREQHNDNTLTYDSFNWKYNHDQIVKDFATHSIGILEDNVDKNIVKSIELVSTSSPKFYNYTTDSYVMAVTFNESNLAKYVAENRDAIDKIVESRHDSSSIENVQHAALCHLFDNCMTQDDYNMTMWESEHEVYSNNTDYELVKKDS